MGKLVEGLWDCPYCGANAISGKIRVCPHCAKPRDKDTRFYIGEAKNYVTEEQAAQINKNPDWICSYCNSLNSDSDTHCKSCGASREDSEKNYLENKKEQEEKEQALLNAAAQDTSQEKAAGRGSIFRRLLPIVAIAAILFFVISALMPKKAAVTVLSKDWERQVAVEELRAVQESGWNYPADAYNLQTRQEIHHYDQVLDHYEKRERQVAEQVLDGYDTVVTGYEDLGNGYFEEKTEQVPRYRTEYHTEYYDEPVYLSIPVYASKYYYTVDKWVYERTETTSGRDTEPYFADRTLLKGNERFGQTSELYTITARIKDETRTYTVSRQLWEVMSNGTSYLVTIDGRNITAIE